jgi:hypothetical protein
MNPIHSHLVLTYLVGLEAASRGRNEAVVSFTYGSHAMLSGEKVFVVMDWFGQGIPETPLHAAAEAAIGWAVRVHGDQGRGIYRIEAVAPSGAARCEIIERVLSWFDKNLPQHVEPLRQALDAVGDDSRNNAP